MQCVLHICLIILLIGIAVNGCFRVQEFRFHSCNYVHNKVWLSVYRYYISSTFRTKKSEKVNAK